MRLHVAMLAFFLLLPGAAVQSAAAADAAAQAAPVDVETPVEVLLFDTDHLASIQSSARLEYGFSWSGEGAFSDRIVLSVLTGGERRVEPDYLSGVHHVDFPPVADAHGNPLLLYFLESDLREMQRQTQGRADYFRRLIRRALARPDLAIEAIEVPVDGHMVHAQRIVLTPFTADPDAPRRYPALKDKAYEFVLSPEVPGQIVSLTSRVIPQGGGAAQVVRVAWTRLAPMSDVEKHVVPAKS